MTTTDFGCIECYHLPAVHGITDGGLEPCDCCERDIYVHATQDTLNLRNPS